MCLAVTVISIDYVVGTVINCQGYPVTLISIDYVVRKVGPVS